MNLEDRYPDQTKITSLPNMYIAIDNARSITEMNRLRKSVVTLMKDDVQLLHTWQKKYEALKRCSTCGGSSSD